MIEKIVGKYRFHIIDNTLDNEGRVYNRNFKIGGNYEDCVNVSIKYDNEGKAISAKIPTLMYDSECSLGTPLDRGEGSIIMIKTLLRYIHNELPGIKEFVFDDNSSIECGTEEEQHRKRHRKRGTHAVPTSLYYFSLAFNGITWYEKHFNAYQEDKEIHKEYRKRVKELLKSSDIKPNFDEFLQIATPPKDILNELKILYEKSETYGEFFESIRKEDRCRLVRSWIVQFMEHYLKGVFNNKNWVIDVTKMDDKKENVYYGGTRKKGRMKKVYYCPKGRINRSSSLLYDIGM